jgi:hypothetical protein
MVGKFQAAINTAKAVKTQKAVNTDIPNSVEPDLQQTINTDLQLSVNTDADPLVSLTIKVPLSKRNHWQVEAKRSRTTVTEVVVDALESKFGSPENRAF